MQNSTVLAVYSIVVGIIAVSGIMLFELYLKKEVNRKLAGFQLLSQKTISNLIDLKSWLIEQKIDFSGWGQGNAKSINDLLLEILQGDTQIRSNPARRQVEVAVVMIKAGNKYLIETEQVLADKRIRKRHWPPSEKLHINESVHAATVRCLNEELGIEKNRIESIRITADPSKELKASDSYPGLETEYTFHLVEADVYGLPKSGFETLEKEETAFDPVQRHRWIWGELPPKLQAMVS